MHEMEEFAPRMSGEDEPGSTFFPLQLEDLDPNHMQDTIPTKKSMLFMGFR